MHWQHLHQTVPIPLATLLDIFERHINSSVHTLTDKSIEKKTCWMNIKLSKVSVLVNAASASAQSFSSNKTQHACTNANVYDVFFNALGVVAQCPYNWGVGSAFHPMKIHIFKG